MSDTPEQYGMEWGTISDSDIWDNDNLPMSLLGGGVSESGESVNKHTALKHHAVWRAVQMISHDISKTNVHVYRRDDDDTRTRDKQHPASVLIRRKPSSFMTAFNFWQAILLYLCVTGNSYAGIVRKPNGEPIELLPLPADDMYPVRKDGELYYVYVPANTNKQYVFDPQDVLHFRYMTFDGIIGLSPLHYARDTFGLGLAAHKWQDIFFKQGAKLSVIVKHPNKLNNETVERIKRAFSDLYSGVGNAHKVGVLQEGMDITPFSVNPKDSQVIELLAANVKEVANIYGIPPHRLGDSTNASYSSLEQENQSYLGSALDPIMVCMEQEMNTKLLSSTEQMNETHFIEFDRKAWLRADLTTQSAYYVNALSGAPHLTINEVRKLQNMQPLDDARANTLLLPSNNYAPDSSTANETDDGATQNGYAAQLDAVLMDTATRAFKRCCGQIKLGDMQAFYLSYRDKMEPGISADFASVAELYAAMGVGDAQVLSGQWVEFVLNEVSSFATELNKKQYKKETLFGESLLALSNKIKETVKWTS
jgi:HK97 family phage portal protein